MNDESFLNYCYAHARTERALFNTDDIKRLVELAGTLLPVGWRPDEWCVMRPEVADTYIEMARKRLRAARCRASDELLAAGFVEGAEA